MTKEQLKQARQQLGLTQAANYIAHAINSHDELVTMNKELLEALEIAAEDLGFKIEPITTKQDGL